MKTLTDDELIDESLNVREKLSSVSDAVSSLEESDERFSDDFDRRGKVFIR